ncbi:MAG TPA: hypothetical protein VGK36_20375 [Candidatus Angelobacter sp.]|jgi:hypothetical protein
MSQPVWVLSVDLQTKTATFQSGMADAAKSARGAFKDIKQGADDMEQSVGYSMSESRHSVMILGEEFGVHLPRSLTTFVSSLGPIGPALEAAFPFLAIILGATLFLEHLAKVREEAEKLEQAQGKFETATNNAFNALQGKLLQAEIQADELNKNHLGALHHQLELIDRQSMDELVHSFDIISKAADVVFAQLKSHWYTQGIGADGAKHALEGFQTQYESLLAQGKDKDAHDLLAGTLQTAERIRAMQGQFQSSQVQYGNGVLSAPTSYGDTNKFEEAKLALQKAGVGTKENEVAAQDQLVKALTEQVRIEQVVSDLKKAQSGNAQHRTNNAVTGDAYRALKEQMDADKAAEAQADKDWQEGHNKAIARLESGERDKIAATKQGSQARLQVIDAALKDEEKYGLQETTFYHSLGVQRVETARQMAEEEARIKAEAGHEAAQFTQKMAELDLNDEKEAVKLKNSQRRVTQQELLAQDIHFANEESDIQKTSLDKQIAALDKSDKDYINKLQALKDKEKELERQHQTQVTDLVTKAEIERNARILSAEQKLQDDVARGLASTLMRHQSFTALMGSLGDQLAAGMIQNALKSMMADDMTKEKDAAHAARKAFNAGMEFPFPANIIAAPAMGAAAFASVMAFEKGGLVPGVGRGDVVPAVLSPGEHVDDKELTDGLRGMVRNGGAGPRNHVQVHYRPTYHVSTIDGDGIRGVLQEHSEEFHQHFSQTVRRMNQ